MSQAEPFLPASARPASAGDASAVDPSTVEPGDEHLESDMAPDVDPNEELDAEVDPADSPAPAHHDDIPFTTPVPGERLTAADLEDRSGD